MRYLLSSCVIAFSTYSRIPMPQCEQLLWIFGCSEETIVYALPYMRIYSSGSLFVMMALGMNMFVTTQGFATVSMRSPSPMAMAALGAPPWATSMVKALIRYTTGKHSPTPVRARAPTWGIWPM